MYGKIYEQTFTGSMYGAGSHIFAVWSYVIAHTKPDAMVELNPIDLAHRLGEDVDKIRAAIEHFKSPDPGSRSHEFEGRRLLQKGEYIYFVPQYHKYHGFANNKERREYFATKKREQRQRDKECQTVKSKESKNVKQSDTDTNPESDTKEHPLTPSRGKCPSLKEAVDFIGTETIGTEFWDYYESNGWRVGRNPMKDWKAAARRWKRNPTHGTNGQREMSAFEIEKRLTAITAEINATFRRNGGQRVPLDGIDNLKQRRDELKRQLTA